MAKPGIYPVEIVCRNEDCPDAGKTNVRRFGKTNAGVQRYQCRTCKRTFTQTKGTLFYNLHTPAEIVLACFAALAKGRSPSAIRAARGIKEETLAGWLQTAVHYRPEVDSVLQATYRLKPAELDTLWQTAALHAPSE